MQWGVSLSTEKGETANFPPLLSDPGWEGRIVIPLLSE